MRLGVDGKRRVLVPLATMCAIGADIAWGPWLVARFSHLMTMLEGE
jgi:hypothetical protein